MSSAVELGFGEVAQRVSPYEDEGLIPEPERTDSGYRDYDSSVVDRIRSSAPARLSVSPLGELNQVGDPG